MKPSKLTKEEHNYIQHYIQHDVKATYEVFNYLKGSSFTTLPGKESVFSKLRNYVKKRQHIKQIKLKEEMCSRAIKSKVCSGFCYSCAWNTEEHE